jgi:hypothetical protein
MVNYEPKDDTDQNDVAVWHHQIVGGVVYTRYDPKALEENEQGAVFIEYIAVQENFEYDQLKDEHHQQVNQDNYDFFQPHIKAVRKLMAH